MRPELPIAALEAEFRAGWARGPVVVTAPTGSGKSTCVPLWIADAGLRVLVVEPRRVACRTLARFVARQQGSVLGTFVGYAVRHEDHLSDDTRVGYVTPGVALQMLATPELAWDAVLLDEFHERSVELDLLLAVLRARGQRQLGLLSATLDGQRLARALGGAWLRGEGRQYPVRVDYLGDRALPHARHLPERVADALCQLGELAGDVLVFLPGKAEIAACHAQLQHRWSVLPLHGELPPQQQDRAFETTDEPKVVLSTNVAETSVTLPGVRAVIDSGLVRRTVYREGRGALALTPVAQDSADQRAGRAGRLGPGRCLRLWQREGRLEARTPPEIRREDLSGLVLAALRLGHRPEDLPWIDPPRDFALDEARQLLGRLNLLDEKGELTPGGREAGRLPVDPVLGRLLIAGRDCEALDDVIPLVAALSIGRPLFIRGEPAVPEVLDPDPLTDPRCDATALILALRRPDAFRRRLRGESLAEAGRVIAQLQRLFGRAPVPAEAPVDRPRLVRAVLSALPDCAFARRARRDAWGNGRHELRLARESLIEDEVKTIVVVDQRLLVDGHRPLRRIATCAMPVAPELLRRLGAGRHRVHRVWIEEGVLHTEQRWGIGTTDLARFDAVPQGPAAGEALLRALTEGRVFAEAIDDARLHLGAFNLKTSLEDGTQLDFDSWLRRRVEALQFESGADLALLTAADFDPALLEPAERAAIDGQFPQRLQIARVPYTVSYDAARREATVQGSTAPRVDFLPRWPGWAVLFNDGKKTLTLKR